MNDHDLASCIRYLPDGAGASGASKRFIADKATRASIDRLLSQCPEKSSLVCLLCDRLTPDDKKDKTLGLSDNADAIVYHMEAK